MKIEDLWNDPINMIIAFVLASLIVLFVKFVVPILRQLLTRSLGEKNLNILYQLVAQAVQAVEQARRKGELDEFAEALGLDLSDFPKLAETEKLREYAVMAVQKFLDKYPWGKLIDVGAIQILVWSLLRQDIHKGPTDPIQEIQQAPPDVLVRVLSADQIDAAYRILTELRAGNVGLSMAKPISRK